jgi:hypothetical protein
MDARDGAEAHCGCARGRDAPGRVVAREERPLGRPPGVRGDGRRWGGGGRGGCREGGRGGGEGRHRIRRRGREGSVPFACCARAWEGARRGRVVRVVLRRGQAVSMTCRSVFCQTSSS